MTKKAFDKIKSGLEDALETAKGKPMTSMVERIARVIDPEAFELHARQYAYGIGLGETREQAQRAADGLFGARVKRAMDRALAALREMRVATWQMCAAGGVKHAEMVREGSADADDPDIRFIFTAAIDAEIAAYEARR